MLFRSPDGRSDGDIYNLNGEHIGNDKKDDNKVYLYHTTDNSQMTSERAAELTSGGGMGPNLPLTDVTSETGMTNNELNLRSSLSTLKQAEAGRSR